MESLFKPIEVPYLMPLRSQLTLLGITNVLETKPTKTARVSRSCERRVVVVGVVGGVGGSVLLKLKPLLN